MKKVLYIIIYIICVPLLFLAACNVHEWPKAPEKVKIPIKLKFDTEMTEWRHIFDGTSVVEKGLGHTYDNGMTAGIIRYIVRAYPVDENQRMLQGYTDEFIITKDVSDGYDHELTIGLLPGQYKIMVWADLIRTKEDVYFYDADDFADIMLQGEHQANTDYRDAFRGKNNILYASDLKKRQSDTLEIVMQRPLAKFELKSDDAVEFIRKCAQSRSVNLEDYKFKIFYLGFMPNAYSLYTDKPVDSATGVSFETVLSIEGEAETSMGFDYVFVREETSVIAVRLGVYDKDGNLFFMSKSLEIPLRPNHHTILSGDFFMHNALGGVNLNPDYDGNYNLILP